jgi:hypothetical protein
MWDRLFKEESIKKRGFKLILIEVAKVCWANGFD